MLLVTVVANNKNNRAMNALDRSAIVTLKMMLHTGLGLHACSEIGQVIETDQFLYYSNNDTEAMNLGSIT